MTIPPWLNIQPQMFLDAAEAGSRLGLQKQQIADSEREASDRSALEGQRLGMEQGNENARLAQMATEEAQRRQDAALQSQQWNLNRGDRLNEAAVSQTDRLAAIANKKARIDAENKRTLAPKYIHTANGIFEIQPDGTLKSVYTPPAKQQFETQNKYVQPIDAKPADVTPASGGSLNPFNWGAGATPARTNSPAVDAVPGHWVSKRIPISAAGDASPLDLQTTAPAATPTTKQPSGFIGTPGGANQFDPAATGYTMQVPGAATGLQTNAPAVTPAPTTDSTPKKGDVVDGYVFQGGDPSDQSNWKQQ